MSTTELNTEGGMHIESDPKTGAIAASNAAAVEEAIAKTKNDQPEQTEKAEQEQPSDPIDPRKAIMEKIYASRGEQFKKELEYAAAIDQGASVEPIVEDNGQEAVAEERPAKKVVKEEKQEVAVAPAKRQVNVGGQFYDLTEAEIEQLAQRTIYAEQQARQQPQYAQPQQQQVQQTQQVQQPELNRDQLKEIARKITYGSEEESTKALADFAGLTAGLASRQTIDPNQLVQATTNQVLAQVQFQNNLEAISREYADVFNDADKTFIAARKVGELRQKNALLGIQKHDLDLYREACGLTREKFGTTSETASIAEKTNKVDQPVTARVDQTRVERKRSAPSTPAALNKTQAMDGNRGQPTGSDVVAAMRKARGQSAA